MKQVQQVQQVQRRSLISTRLCKKLNGKPNILTNEKKYLPSNSNEHVSF